jgi:integrase
LYTIVVQGDDPTVDAVRPAHVQAFLFWRRTHSPDGSRRRKPLAPRSLANARRYSAFDGHLEVTESNPVAGVPRTKGDVREPVTLSQEEYERLIAACEDRPMVRFYVLALGESGVRCNSEALWLPWADVDLKRGLLRVESVRRDRRTKSGKRRVVPMTLRLRAAARAHVARFGQATYEGKRSP